MSDRAPEIYNQVKEGLVARTKRFYAPKSGEKPPVITILTDPPYTPLHHYNLPQPKFAAGDWVTWAAPWPKSAGCSPVVSRLARVSKIERLDPWRPVVYHLRLHEPVEYPGGRRWAYSAAERELSEPSAVDRLGRLTA